MVNTNETILFKLVLLQTEHYISIGSGAVESAIKQIDRRLKISGAQWNHNWVTPMLRLRCVTRS